MIKSTLKISLFCLIVAALASAPALRAQETNHNHTATEKKAKEEGNAKKATPFHGKLKAVDKTAKTITIGETTVQITSETKLEKAGKPATLADAVVGEEVGGAYKKADDGKLNATKIRFGAKVEEEGKAKTEKTEKTEKKDK